MTGYGILKFLWTTFESFVRYLRSFHHLSYHDWVRIWTDACVKDESHSALKHQFMEIHWIGLDEKSLPLPVPLEQQCRGLGLSIIRSTLHIETSLLKTHIHVTRQWSLKHEDEQIIVSLVPLADLYEADCRRRRQTPRSRVATGDH